MEHATSANTSNLAAKKDFFVLKTEVDKLGINKLSSIPTSLNDLISKNRWFRCWSIKICTSRLEKIKWCSRLLETQHSTHWKQK